MEVMIELIVVKTILAKLKMIHLPHKMFPTIMQEGVFKVVGDFKGDAHINLITIEAQVEVGDTKILYHKIIHT